MAAGITPPLILLRLDGGDGFGDEGAVAGHDAVGAKAQGRSQRQRAFGMDELGHGVLLLLQIVRWPFPSTW